MRNPQAGGAPGGGLDSPGNNQMLMDIFKAGGRVVAGTDTPNAVNLHGELDAYVNAGMTPFQALRAATATPAEALNLDAGVIAAGKLADIVIVEGNPLERIGDALKVRRVMANGRVYEMSELVRGATTTTAAR